METLEQQGYTAVLHNVPITGTNHSAVYASQASWVGRRLRLARIRHNAHDPNAVRVICEDGFAAHDLGWIGQQTGHSEMVAGKLDTPCEGVIVVTYHSCHAEPLKRMYGTVYTRPQQAKGLPKKGIPLHDRPEVTVIYADGAVEARADLSKHNGRLLRLRTTRERVSVTLEDAHGTKQGWYRKTDFQDAAAVEGKVALVANKSTVFIISEADAKANGYVFRDPEVKSVPAFEAVDDEVDRQVIVGGSQVGKTAKMEAFLRKNLHIPDHVEVRRSQLKCWLIRAPGEHWRHLCKDSGTADDLVRARAFVEKEYPRAFVEKEYPPKPEIKTAAGRAVQAAIAAQIQTQTEKGTTMNFNQQAKTVISFNKNAAGAAAYMEAGRIANNQVAKFISSKAPFIVKGYVNTPVGKLVLANVAAMAVRQFRPDQAQLVELTDAMAVQAYQEILQHFDIEGFLSELLDSKEIKRATEKLSASRNTGTVD